MAQKKAVLANIMPFSGTDQEKSRAFSKMHAGRNLLYLANLQA